MQAPREFHQATRLSNGEVMVAGGDDSLNVLASTELCDPTSGTFGTDATMAVPRGIISPPQATSRGMPTVFADQHGSRVSLIGLS